MECPDHGWECTGLGHESARQHVDPLDYGDTVPGVTCPSCGGELVHTSNGAFCDECRSYVPIVGSAVIVNDDEDDDSDWIDDER